MSTKSKSIFSRTNINKVNLSTKIPATLKERADQVKKDLKEVAPELEFSLPEIVEQAISDAVAKAEKEISQMRKHPSTADLAAG